MLVLRLRRRALAILLPAFLLAVAAVDPAPAQETEGGDSAAAAPDADLAALEGLVIPEPPETMATNAEGEITIRAVRLEEPLELDGALDEGVYDRVEPASGLTQWEPVRGEPATEDTRLWVFYDDRNVYLALRAESEDPDEIVANEMRRDHRNVWMNDNLIVSLDTFLDRRTGVFFQTNALGAVRDGLIVDENTTNYDWNTVWDVRSRIDEGGWSTEMAIPFESLQYEPGREQVWGINVHRAVRSLNEFSVLATPPPSYNSNPSFRMSSAATLVGLEAPGEPARVEVRPYAISTVTTDRPADVTNDLDGEVGFDARYAVTPSLNLDATYNTDFAQVEIDEQQVNLTRFSLLFPEKRDFFLEGQSVFDFAGTGERTGGRNRAGPDPTPYLFFSRRIGLQSGQTVPIEGGGRLMGRAGPLSMGALYIRTGAGDALSDEGGDPLDPRAPELAVPATDFGVARIKSDVFERSTVGALATWREPSLAGTGSNVAYGVDTNLSPTENIWLTGFYARTETSGVPEVDPVSFLARAEYDADRYGLRVERLEIGEDFSPGVGLLRRTDIQRSYVRGRISRRPESLQRWTLEGSVDRYVNGDGVLETDQEQVRLRLEFLSSDRVDVDVTRSYEFLPDPFVVAGGGVVQPGSYRFWEVSTRLEAGPQRWISGNVEAGTGGFFGGSRSRLGYNGRMEFGARFALEPRVSVDWVDLGNQDYRVTLLGARPTFAINPWNFLSALVQYNSAADAVESNIRWRWELEPGTILYVVYTDARLTAFDPVLGTEGLVNRSLAVKFTRLMRF